MGSEERKEEEDGRQQRGRRPLHDGAYRIVFNNESSKQNYQNRVNIRDRTVENNN